MKRFIFYILLAITAIPAIAQTTFTSVTTGDWDDGATWGNTSPGVQGTDWPAATDHAIIDYGHSVTLLASQGIVNFTINFGGQFNFNGFTLTPSGAVSPFIAQTTGDFDVAGTWLNGSAPGTTNDDILVSVNVRVTLATGTIVNDLSINSAGVFDDGNKTIQVDGRIYLNGTVAGSKNLEFSGGAGTSIDGAGGHSAKNFDINGNTEILSTAYLTFGQTVNMTNGGTTTNNGTVILNAELKSTGAASTWINAANSSLKVTASIFNGGGILEASATGNTVIYSQAGGQTIIAPTANTYNNLTISGTDTKTFPSTVIVLGDILIESGTLEGINPTNSLFLGGDLTSTGTFNARTSTVTFDGTTDQTITSLGGLTFYDLVLDKTTGTLNLADDIITSNSLTLTQGIIDAGTSMLTLGTGTGAEGTLTHTAGQIIGQFERWIATGTAGTDVVFPVGSTTNTNTATINFTGITTGGTVIFQFIESNPGNAGLSLDDAGTMIYNTFVDGYWDMSTANSFDLGASTFTLNLDGTGFTAFTITTVTRLLTRADAGSNWLAEGAHVAAADPIANRSGLSTMPAQYAFGDDTNCTPPSTSVITGTSEVCTEETPVGYSVVNTVGSTYAWTITGGTQISGTNTSSITVDWGTAGMAGNVRVVETNTCTSGAAVDFPVNVNSIPPTSITGKTIIAESTLGEAYSVMDLGYTYTWTITGGTIAGGDGSSAITVDWGLAGVGNVSVVAQKVGCNAAPAFDVDVIVYDIINSAQIGDWDVGTTWETGTVPTSIENARILNGHVVTITADETINHLIINIGGTVSNPSKKLTIDGDFTNNWFYTGGSKPLVLAGINTTIDGTGTIQVTGNEIQITTGNKTISSTAVLSIPFGTLDIANGITITNKGSVSIKGAITGGNATSSIWINDANSNLTLTSSIFGGNKGLLNASATGNHVLYNGTAQTVFAKAAANTYYHLTLEGSGTKTLDGNILINGDFDLSGTARLATAGNSVTLSGTTTQTMTDASSGIDFDDLIINNTYGTIPQITTSGAINVASSATFTDGVIDNKGTFTFTDATATSTTDSYIDGPVTFIDGTNTTGFSYPLGNGSVWARLDVSGLTASSQFTGQYFYTDPLVAIGATIDVVDFPDPAATISSEEYWQLDYDGGGTPSAIVTLYWEDGARSGITDLTDLTITRWDGTDTDWGDDGIATTVSGTVATGSVTSNAAYSVFSPFTFASPLGKNALPVELVYFRGKMMPKGVVLEWQTASELNNDFFEVEVSTNGENYTTIANIVGQGTTTTLTNYDFVDRYPSTGLNYYRLKQVDFNGDFTYSRIISIMNDAPARLFFSAYPQPASSHLTLQLMAIDDINVMNLVIYNMNGRIIKKISIDPNTKQLPVDISAFTNGLYLVRLHQAGHAYHGKLLIQK